MRAISPLHVERILVIQTAFLGDIVLSTPFLAGARRVFPKAEIRFLTTPAGAKLLSPNPWDVIPVPYDKRRSEKGFSGFLRKWRELEGFAPELTFCLHRSFRSALLARAAGGEICGFTEAAGSFLFRRKQSRNGYTYEADKNNALLQEFARSAGVELPRFPALEASAADDQEGIQLVGSLGEFAVLAPSSVWATKRWPADRFAELALGLLRRHGLRSVVVGGNESADKAAARDTVTNFLVRCAEGEKSAIPVDLSGKTSLGALKSVLSRARIVVSNDSAPLHMAIAMGTPVVGVFGPTTKELGFFPLAPEGKSGVAEVIGLPCRPCGMHGHHKCPERHFRCMLDLGSARVLEEVDKILCR